MLQTCHLEKNQNFEKYVFFENIKKIQTFSKMLVSIFFSALQIAVYRSLCLSEKIADPKFNFFLPFLCQIGHIGQKPTKWLIDGKLIIFC